MAEFTENRDFRTVTLIDRTGQGAVEIIYDGVRIPLPKGVTEKAVPRFVAAWLFRVGQQMVWTADGRYVNRFGIKDPSDDLVAELGVEVGDISPITIDTQRSEGWDTSGVDRSAHTVVTLNLPPVPLRERQGTREAAFGERKE